MAKRKIWLGPIDNGVNGPLIVEGTAATAFLPGTLLTQSGTTLAVSSAANTVSVLPLFAAEISETEEGTISTAATVGDTAEAIQGRSGEFLNVRVATGQTVVKGSPMVSNGSGLLVVGTGAQTQHTIAFADEVVTTTATTLVRVRIA